MKRITSAAVIASTVLFLVVNVMHPKEYTRGHELQQLDTIAGNYTRWQLTHFLTFVAVMLFVFVVVGLALLLAERRPQLAVIGGALGLCGLVAIGGVLALDGFTWGALGQVYTWPSVDQASIAHALHSVQEARWNLPFYAGSLAWLIGLAVLAVGLVRERVLPAWAGYVFALGAFMVGIEAAIGNNAYFVVAAAVLAVGGVGVGAALRDDDRSDSTRIGHVRAG